MSPVPGLDSAAQQMSRLIAGVADEQLTAPTPCAEYALGDLIDHVSGLSQGFTAAAKNHVRPRNAKTAVRTNTDGGDVARLDVDWRVSIPRQLATLAAAWRDPGALEGMTQAGGVDMPADMAATIVTSELVIHGWDVARASRQPFEADQAAPDTTMQFMSLISIPGQEAAREGGFGPVIDTAPDAPLLDRVIGLSGRDPTWMPGLP